MMLSHLCGGSAPQETPVLLLATRDDTLQTRVADSLDRSWSLLAAHSVDAVQAHTADVSRAILLADAALPASGCRALVEELRGQAHTQHMPICVLTSAVDDPHALAALAAGADDLMLRPISAPRLSARLRTLLGLCELRRLRATLDVDVVRLATLVARSVLTRLTAPLSALAVRAAALDEALDLGDAPGALALAVDRALGALQPLHRVAALSPITADEQRETDLAALLSEVAHRCANRWDLQVSLNGSPTITVSPDLLASALERLIAAFDSDTRPRPRTALQVHRTSAGIDLRLSAPHIDAETLHARLTEPGSDPDIASLSRYLCVLAAHHQLGALGARLFVDGDALVVRL